MWENGFISIKNKSENESNNLIGLCASYVTSHFPPDREYMCLKIKIRWENFTNAQEHNNFRFLIERERERVTRKKEMKKGQKSKISSLCILGVDVMERKEEFYVYFVRHFFPESLLIARKATNTTGYVRNITCSFLWWVKRHFTTFYFIFSVCVSLSFRFVSHFCAGFLVSDSSVKVDGCIGK